MTEKSDTRRGDDTVELARRVRAYEAKVEEQREAVRRLAVSGRHLAEAVRALIGPGSGTAGQRV